MPKSKLKRKYSRSKLARYFSLKLDKIQSHSVPKTKKHTTREYTVEKILDEKIKKGKRFYLIKWKNWARWNS